MIPKKIHFCWLSEDPFPEKIRVAMDSWRKHLPDYEFVHWDLKRFPLEKNLWVRQAFETKKYAFAADYIRLYAVYNEGGVYLDTDVEVVKPFGDLLQRPYFIGSEGEQIIEAGVFGAAPKTEWVGDCLEYYEGKSFIKEDGSFDMMTLPRIMMQQISAKRKIVEQPKVNGQIYSDDELVMFPQDYFCAKNQGSGIIRKTANTYTIHHFAMSWKSDKSTAIADAKRKMISIFGEKFVYGVINLLGLKKLRNAGSK